MLIRLTEGWNLSLCQSSTAIGFTKCDESEDMQTNLDLGSCPVQSKVSRKLKPNAS